MIENDYLDIIEYSLKYRKVLLQRRDVARYATDQQVVKHQHSRKLLIKSAKTITALDPIVLTKINFIQIFILKY